MMARLAEAGLAIMGADRRLCGEEPGTDIQPHHPVKVLPAHVLKRRRLCCPGIVDEDIGDKVREQRIEPLARVGRRQIEGGKVEGQLLPAQTLAQSGELIPAPGDPQNLRAVPRKDLAGVGADAPARTGDADPLARQPARAHAVPAPVVALIDGGAAGSSTRQAAAVAEGAGDRGGHRGCNRIRPGLDPVVDEGSVNPVGDQDLTHRCRQPCLRCRRKAPGRAHHFVDVGGMHHPPPWLWWCLRPARTRPLAPARRPRPA